MPKIYEHLVLEGAPRRVFADEASMTEEEKAYREYVVAREKWMAVAEEAARKRLREALAKVMRAPIQKLLTGVAEISSEEATAIVESAEHHITKPAPAATLPMSEWQTLPEELVVSREEGKKRQEEFDAAVHGGLLRPYLNDRPFSLVTHENLTKHTVPTVTKAPTLRERLKKVVEQEVAAGTLPARIMTSEDARKVQAVVEKMVVGIPAVGAPFPPETPEEDVVPMSWEEEACRRYDAQKGHL